MKITFRETSVLIPVEFLPIKSRNSEQSLYFEFAILARICLAET